MDSLAQEPAPSAAPNLSSLPPRKGWQRTGAIIPLSRWFGVWVVRWPALAGILAFAITGFLGFAGTLPTGSNQLYLFQRPVALTLFGVGLGMLMQWLMLTHPTPQLEQAGERGPVAPSRARVLKAFLATLLSLAFIAFLDLQPGRVGDALQSASDVVASHSVILLVALLFNAYFIVTYLVYLVEQWVPRIWRRERAARVPMAVLTARRRQTAILGVIATDLISGALFFGVLAAIFSSWLFTHVALFTTTSLGFLGIPVQNTSVDECTLALTACPSASGEPFTLALFDVVSALLLLFLAAITLTLYVAERRIFVDRPPNVVEREARMGLRSMRRALLGVLEGLVRPLRRGLWPLLVFVGVFAISVAARSAQAGLSVLNQQHQAWWYGLTNTRYGAAFIEINPDNWKYLAYSLVAALIAATFFFASVLIQLYETRNQAGAVQQVSEYWSWALAQWARSLVIPIGLASVAFALITGVLIIFQSVGWIDRTGRLPLSFFPPGVLALFAALVFGYDLSRGAISRRRKRATR